MTEPRVSPRHRLVIRVWMPSHVVADLIVADRLVGPVHEGDHADPQAVELVQSIEIRSDRVSGFDAEDHRYGPSKEAEEEYRWD